MRRRLEKSVNIRMPSEQRFTDGVTQEGKISSVAVYGVESLRKTAQENPGSR